MGSASTDGSRSPASSGALASVGVTGWSGARVGADVLNEATLTARGAVPGWMGSTGKGRGKGDSSSTMTSRRGFRGARGFDCDARRKVASCGVVVGTS